MEVGKETEERTFSLLADPRSKPAPGDVEARLKLRLGICDKLSEISAALSTIGSVSRQVDDWVRRSKGKEGWEAVGSAGAEIIAGLAPIETQLTRTSVDGKPDDLARLDAKLMGLAKAVDMADGAPTRQSHEVFDVLSARVDVQLADLRRIVDADVQAFATRLQRLDVPLVVVTEPLASAQVTRESSTGECSA